MSDSFLSVDKLESFAQDLESLLNVQVLDVLMLERHMPTRKMIDHLIVSLGAKKPKQFGYPQEILKHITNSNQNVLIIYDISYEKYSFKEFMAKVKAVKRDFTTQVVATAMPHLGPKIKEAVALGATQLILKPIDQISLKDKIKGVLQLK